MRDESYSWIDDDYSVGYVTSAGDGRDEVAIIGVIEENNERREVYIGHAQAEGLIKALRERL